MRCVIAAVAFMAVAEEAATKVEAEANPAFALQMLQSPGHVVGTPVPEVDTADMFFFDPNERESIADKFARVQARSKQKLQNLADLHAAQDLDLAVAVSPEERREILERYKAMREAAEKAAQVIEDQDAKLESIEELLNQNANDQDKVSKTAKAQQKMYNGFAGAANQELIYEKTADGALEKAGQVEVFMDHKDGALDAELKHGSTALAHAEDEIERMDLEVDQVADVVLAQMDTLYTWSDSTTLTLNRGVHNLQDIRDRFTNLDEAVTKAQSDIMKLIQTVDMKAAQMTMGDDNVVKNVASLIQEDDETMRDLKKEDHPYLQRAEEFAKSAWQAAGAWL